MKQMKKIISVILSVLLVCGVMSTGGAAADIKQVKEELNFAVVSDPHYYPQSYTGGYCEKWQEFTAKTTKLYYESEAILRTALDTIVMRNSGLKYILIPGDLTKDSEYEAHVQFAALLGEYEEKYGVEFIVTTGNHDVNSDRASTFENGFEEQARAITADEFREVYADYGYDLAFSEFAQKGDNVQGQLSYVVDLGDSFRLFVIDSAIYSFGEKGKAPTEGRVTDELMAWIEELAADAREKNKTSMVMLHHSLAPHMETEPSITFAFVLEDYLDVAEKFASWGIHYSFSGHLHQDDVASVVNDDGEVLYDYETASVTGYPCTYRENTLTAYTDGESELESLSVDFDAAKPFTFDSKTYDAGTYKYKAFANSFGESPVEEGRVDIVVFLKNIVRSYIDGIVEAIGEEGSIEGYLKTIDIDLEKIISGFLEPYIGDGVSVLGYNIFTTDNIMWFIEDLLGQVYELYFKNPEALYTLVEDVVVKFTGIEVSDEPCTKFIDTLGFGDATKPGTLGDLILSIVAYWYGGNEDTSDDAFMTDAIAGFESGETIEVVFNALVDIIFNDILDEAILSKLEIRINKLFSDDRISQHVAQQLNEGLSLILKGDFTYQNLVDTVFVLGILPYDSLFDVLDKLLLEKYLTFSQMEGIGSFAAFVISDFTSDENPIFKGDLYAAYSSENVEVKATRENYRIPTNVSVTVGENSSTSANISWFSKSTLDGDIEIYKADTEPLFTGVATEGIEVVSETVTRQFPGIDIGIAGFLWYEFDINRHIVTLEDLEPGATYYYRVGDENRGWWSETGKLTTADDSDETSFIYLSDAQSQCEAQYERAWAKVLEKAFEVNPDADFVINTGDMVDHGDNFKQWAWAFNTASDKLMSTYMMPVSGNHEGHGTNAVVNNFVLPSLPEQDTSAGAYYSFDYNNVHIAVLNTEDLTESGTLSSKQIDWLKEDISGSDATWNIVALHKAIYSQGSHYADDDVCAMRAQLGAFMPEIGIDLVLQGHDHVYMRTGSLVNNVNVGYEKAYLNFGENVYKAQVLPYGTTYVISGTCGVKTYVQNDVSVTDEYFPRAEKILAVDAPMFSSIKILDGILYFDAYKLENGEAVECDRFAIQKNVTQGDVNADYVDPDESTDTENGEIDDLLWTVFKVFTKLFKLLEVLINILNHYFL